MKDVFYGIGIFSFFIILFIFIFAPIKNQKRIVLWSLLKILFFVSLFFSWRTDNIVLKWILIEVSTLLGAVLISSSGTKKTFQVGWKFLLINSYSLGIAFLGLILLLFASTELQELNFANLKLGLEGGNKFLIESGILLVIFGYSGKLGLVPNHQWVGDTYAESSSQISSLIASFVPVSILLAIRPFFQLEREINHHWFNTVNVLIFMGGLTILFATFILQIREDIRRITAKIALFHTGLLPVCLWFGEDDDFFYFLLASTVILKLILFLAMGILRLDAGTRFIPEMLKKISISKKSYYVYLISLFVAFVFPLSPIFVLDLELIRRISMSENFVFLLFPILSVFFFYICLKKILPIIQIPNRDFFDTTHRILTIRIITFYFVFFVSILLSIYGGHFFLRNFL